MALPAQAADHWAMPYAQQLVNWGVMRGDTSGALRLGSSITRAEFVAMMNRAYGYVPCAAYRRSGPRPGGPGPPPQL